jgi:hypothetical protein
MEDLLQKGSATAQQYSLIGSRFGPDHTGYLSILTHKPLQTTTGWAGPRNNNSLAGVSCDHGAKQQELAVLADRLPSGCRSFTTCGLVDYIFSLPTLGFKEHTHTHASQTYVSRVKACRRRERNGTEQWVSLIKSRGAFFRTV